MNHNPLRYDDKATSFGRKSRLCHPCEERESYIVEYAKKGESTISLRQKNRYIDEFIVYLAQHHDYRKVTDISSEQLLDYITYVEADSSIGYKTAKIKISIVRNWLKWLFKNKVIRLSL